MQNVVDIHALSEDVKNFHLLNEWQAIYTFILYVRSTYLNNGMIVSIPPHKFNLDRSNVHTYHLVASLTSKRC